jgi:periplasmic protein TonB
MLALRLPFAASSGTLVTLTLFTLLWYLVSGPIDIRPTLSATTVDWTRQRVDTPVEVKRQNKTQRPPPPQVPLRPRTVGTTGVDTPTVPTRERFEPIPVARPEGTPLRPDGDVIPVVRPPPEYPPREIANGTQGWVQVRFAVTTIGTVRDAVVVDADPQKVFEAAALKAIARWRYNPKVENGVPVERVGLQTIIRFQLDE